MKTVFIYVLKDPRIADPILSIRYCGKAAKPKGRLCSHIHRSKKGEQCHRADWIRSLLEHGVKPNLETVDEVPETEWQAWEVAYIQFYREQGCDLTNGTPGGDGASFPGETNPMFGRKHSEESKDKNRESHIGLLMGEKNGMFGVHRFGEAAPNFGKKFSSNWCANISKGKTGKPNPKLSAVRRGKYLGELGSFFGKKHTADAIEKNRLAHIGRKQSRITILKREVTRCLNRVLRTCQPIE